MQLYFSGGMVLASFENAPQHVLPLVRKSQKASGDLFRVLLAFDVLRRGQKTAIGAFCA